MARIHNDTRFEFNVNAKPVCRSLLEMHAV